MCANFKGVCVCVRARAARGCADVLAHAGVSVYVCVYVRVRARAFTRVCVNTHIYIHTFTSTFTTFFISMCARGCVCFVQGKLF